MFDKLFNRSKTQSAIPLHITVKELAERLDGPNRPVVVDVREPSERAIACLPRTVHIRLSELPAKTGKLDPSAEIVVHCHHGMRSMQAVKYLRANGFAHVRNLTGGIAAWSREVDRGVPEY